MGCAVSLIDYAMSDAEYRSETSLSCSGAKMLLPPSCPAIFHYEREHPVFKEVFDFGHTAHRLALGVGSEIVVVDAADWRTKAAKEAQAEARAAGKAPLLAEDYETVKAMAEALERDPIASALLSDGTPEVSIFWGDEGSGVKRKARLDWLPEANGGRMVVPDFKTTASANPDSFVKSATNYRYHMQAAWYLDAVTALELADDPAFVFIVQEKTPPYLVSVIELDSNALRIGRHLNRKAIDIYAECSARNEWPSYTDDVALVSLPYWYEKDFQEIA
jgi:hypothetical protein